MNKQAPFTGRKGQRVYSMQDKRDIVNDIKSGMSNDDLEKKYNRKIDNIRTMLWKQGYSIPELRAKNMRTGL